MVDAREARETDNGTGIIDKIMNRYKFAKEQKDRNRKSPAERIGQASTFTIAVNDAIPARHCLLPIGIASKNDLFRQKQSN